jgi:hypothetical protein
MKNINVVEELFWVFKNIPSVNFFKLAMFFQNFDKIKMLRIMLLKK